MIIEIVLINHCIVSVGKIEFYGTVSWINYDIPDLNDFVSLCNTLLHEMCIKSLICICYMHA